MLCCATTRCCVVLLSNLSLLLCLSLLAHFLVSFFGLSVFCGTIFSEIIWIRRQIRPGSAIRALE